jgi:hypothetical protein
VEAKSFSFLANTGKSVLCLEEKRKGFGGFISLGIQCLDWLADTVEEAIVGKRDFAKSFRDEVRVLKVCKGSNKAGCFLEVAVFFEGGWKGVIRLSKGDGGWGWRRFVDELRHLLVLFVAKDSSTVPVVISGVDGTPPAFAVVLTASPGGLMPSSVEAQTPVGSKQGRSFPLGGGASTLEVLRNMVKKFLAKVRVDVVWVISCGLGLKTKASRGIRKRKNVGHKLKLFSACGPSLRPRPLEAVLRVRPFFGVEGFTGSKSCHKEASPEVILGDSVDPKAVVSNSRMGHLSPARGLLQCSSDGVISGPIAGPDAAVSASPTGKLAVCDPSPAKGLLRHGFLLRQNSVSSPWFDLARSSCGKEWLPSSGSDKAPLGMDLNPVLDLGLDPNPVPDPDPSLDPVLVASLTSLVATISPVIRAPASPAAGSGSLVMLVASVSRVKQFSFPPVLEDALMNSAHAKVSSVSKSTLGLRRAKDREAIQLYRKSQRELEKRLSIACSIYFEDKGGGSRIEVRDVG